jgi:hypothetical protein
VRPESAAAGLIWQNNQHRTKTDPYRSYRQADVPVLKMRHISTVHIRERCTLLISNFDTGDKAKPEYSADLVARINADIKRHLLNESR